MSAEDPSSTDRRLVILHLAIFDGRARFRQA